MKFRAKPFRKTLRLAVIAFSAVFSFVLVVFLVRAFVVEPYSMPSGSMMPTLLAGDYLLVDKSAYGLRVPFTHTKLTQGHPVRRGDVVVFRYPQDKSVDYIKRVIGVPGDVLAYQDKRLTINGRPVAQTPQPDYYSDQRASGNPGNLKQFREDLDGRQYAVLDDPAMPPLVPEAVDDYPYRKNCQYDARGLICTVPPGQYFVLGDNRDDSEDSRYRGFVPGANIAGRVFFVWMNFGNLWHTGSFK